MCYKDDSLVSSLNRLHNTVFENACIFYLIERSIGVSPITSASAIIRALVWPPDKPLIRLLRLISSPVNVFARFIVSASKFSLPGRRALICITRNSSTERSARQRVFWVIRAIGLKAGSRTKDSGGTSPLMRIHLPVTVSPCARVSISFIKADFPEPVGPTIDKVSLVLSRYSQILPSLQICFFQIQW